jgi:hypothetical protein
MLGSLVIAVAFSISLSLPPPESGPGPIPPLDVATLYTAPRTGRMPWSLDPIRAVVVAPPCLYAVCKSGRLCIFDLPSDGRPASSEPVATLSDAGDGNDIAVFRNHLVLTNNSGTRIYAFSDPHTPYQLTETTLKTRAGSHALIPNGNVMFVVGYAGVESLDLSNIAQPRLLPMASQSNGKPRGRTNGWSACVIAEHLYVVEESMYPASACSRLRQTIYHGSKQLFIEAVSSPDGGHAATARLPTTTFHLVAIDDKHLIATFDADVQSHGDSGLAGRAAVVNVTDPVKPTVGPLIPVTGGRAAVAFNVGNEKQVLMAGGGVYRIEGDSLELAHAVKCPGSWTWIAPYRAHATPDWLAMPADAGVTLYRVHAQNRD